MDKNVIIYKLGEKRRPRNSFKIRLLLHLHQLPVFYHFVERTLLKSLHLPMDTSLSPGFYCSSSLLSVGQGVGLGNVHIWAYAPVKIGNYCSFSFDNSIITSSHDYSNFGTVIAKSVVIGDNVWITSNVTILGGVTIGSNTVIGAGSIVTHNIPAGVFAAGNPCEEIKKIKFSIDKVK